MILKVQLHRQSKDESDYGCLRAYVVQDGKRGRNLLANRQLTVTATAKRYITGELQHQIPGVVVQFEKFEGEL